MQVNNSDDATITAAAATAGTEKPHIMWEDTRKWSTEHKTTVLSRGP